MTGGRAKGAVLVVGPLPPPHFGIATSMGHLQALAEREDLSLVFLDIADRRGLANIGLLDVGNVLLALKHGAQFLWRLMAHRPRVVYLSLSQGRLGFLRDCLFLVPARMTGRKVVIHLHGGYFRDFYESQPWWFRNLMAWQLSGAARVIVLGERFRGMFDGIVPGDRVEVIPNGIDPAEIGAGPADGGVDGVAGVAGVAGGGESAEVRVLYLGAVCRDKGVLDLLAALGAVRGRGVGVRLTLAGESYAWEEEAIRRAIEEHGLMDVVDRPGVVEGEAKRRVLREADLFVFPSRNPVGEGQPFVLLEAMAAGLPVVTTDLGTSADTVVDGETGLVVPSAQPAALADAVARLAGDPMLRRRMGAAGLERVRRVYSMDRWRDAMLTTFRDVAAGR